MKKYLVIMIGILSAVMLGLIALLMYAINFGSGSLPFFHHGEAKLVNTQTIKLNTINEISVLYSSEDVYVYESDTNDIIVKEYRRKTPSKSQLSLIKEDGSRLSIHGKRKNFRSFSFFGIGNLSEYTELYLPKEYSKKLDLGTSSGDIIVDGIFKLEAFKVNVSSGDVEIADLSTADLNVNASSGDIQIDEVSVDNLIVNTSSGDISIKDIDGNGMLSASSGDIEAHYKKVSGTISLTTESGDSTLTIPDGTGFDFSAITSSGDINTSFDSKLNFNKDGEMASGLVGNSAASVITMKTSSGDISVIQN